MWVWGDSWEFLKSALKMSRNGRKEEEIHIGSGYPAPFEHFWHLGSNFPPVSSAAVDVIGIVVGHFYWFLADILPKLIGFHILKTPSFVYVPGFIMCRISLVFQVLANS